MRDEVEDIEHHLRPQTLELLARLVHYWKTHPDELQATVRAGVQPIFLRIGLRIELLHGAVDAEAHGA